MPALAGLFEMREINVNVVPLGPLLVGVLVSFVVMGAVLFPLEKRGYLRAVFLVAIGLLGQLAMPIAVFGDVGVMVICVINAMRALHS